MRVREGKEGKVKVKGDLRGSETRSATVEIETCV